MPFRNREKGRKVLEITLNIRNYLLCIFLLNQNECYKHLLYSMGYGHWF